MTDDDRRKHLEFIQAVVTRLAGNSFAIKGWAVALITVLGGLAAKDADVRLAALLLFPALCFWGLDAYYLREERLYRKLYDKVSRGDTSVPDYSLNATLCKSEVAGIVKVAFSPTVRWLHIPIVVFVAIVIVYAAARPGAVSPPPEKPAVTNSAPVK